MTAMPFHRTIDAIGAVHVAEQRHREHANRLGWDRLTQREVGGYGATHVALLRSLGLNGTHIAYCRRLAAGWAS